MRQPKVENTYNLTPYSITQLKINRSKVNETYFLRHNFIKAWYIHGSTAKNPTDYHYRFFNEYWLEVYDEDVSSTASQIKLLFLHCHGLRDYIFDSFYDFSTIEKEMDLEIQEKFLEKINHLIDEGVFIIP